MSETQERWGVWVHRANGTGGWCMGVDKHGHRTYPTREQAQADADATQARNNDWRGHKWEARKYEPPADPRDERIKQLAAENAKLREALKAVAAWDVPRAPVGFGETVNDMQQKQAIRNLAADALK